MASVLKKTTRLTGLKVCKYPHADLIPLYNKILQNLMKFPNDYLYRKETEKLITNRLNIVKQNSDISLIEKEIGCGQIEELIIQARNELSLTKKMLIWKPWENLITQAPVNQWTWPPHK